MTTDWARRDELKLVRALEDDGLLEDTVVNFFSHMINADPTIALRQNIKEACIAMMYVFKDNPEYFIKHANNAESEVINNVEYLTAGYPPGTVGGLVIAADKYMKGFDCPEGSACMRTFQDGRFEFTDALLWQHIYSAWNLGFTLATADVGSWWAKLINPAVLEDKTGESYIIRRAIALYVALFRQAFLNTQRIAFNNVQTKSGIKKCGNRFKVSTPLNVQNFMGEETWFFARDYYMPQWMDDAAIISSMKDMLKTASTLKTVIDVATADVRKIVHQKFMHALFGH